MRERTRTNLGLPPNARAEILEALCANMEISSDEIVAILKRHHVAEDTGVLQAVSYTHLTLPTTSRV